MTRLIVAKSGVNAKTATAPNDFIFHSDYNTFKILAEGTVSPTLGIGTDAVTVNHGQSVKPFVFAFCKFANSRVGPPGTKASNADFWFARVQVDATKIYFHYVNNTAGNYSPTFKYIICESPIT